MSQPIPTLPGFRDFTPEACAVRNYIFEQWRATARRYGFAEYEGPLVEFTELFTRKSGEEIVSQLFAFEKGERSMSLRPEVTPSLARMATARQREYKKPMKWFQIGSCFRYEKPQKGRGREFYQFNCDILGDASPEADAELVAMAIDTMRALGFREGDFFVRLSDRRAWNDFAERENISDRAAFLQVIDKLERDKPEATEAKLAALGTSVEKVRAFIAAGATSQEGSLGAVRQSLAARGLAPYVCVDLGIVRGLAYYTGTVFEVFDAKGQLRAVAGGGRYDQLCALIGGFDMPSAGWAMGDMVAGEFIKETPHAQAKLDSWLAAQRAADVYVVIADEARRTSALALVQRLRDAGAAADYSFTPSKVVKQFQAAESLKARLAIVIGNEYPNLQIKVLANREEIATTAEQVVEQALALLGV